MKAKGGAGSGKVTIMSVLSWVFGVLLMLAGFGGTRGAAVLSGILLILAGLLLLPPVIAFIRARVAVSTEKRAIVIAVLIIVAMVIATSGERSSGAGGDVPTATDTQSDNPPVDDNRTAAPPPDARPSTPENITYQSIRYDDLMRYSDKYRDSYVTYKGEVWQVMDAGQGKFELRIGITNDGLAWSNAVFVDYAAERVLVNDIVNVTGRYDGLATYKTVDGGSATIPRIVDANVTLLVKAGDRRW